MSGVNIAAIAAAAAFATSALWYMLMPDPAGGQGAATRTASSATAATAQRPSVAKLLVEFVRSLAVAGVVAASVGALDVDGWWALIGWSVALWAGFPAVLLAGSIMWDNVAWRTAGIHAGDWLIKLVVITLIVGRWN